MRGLRWSLLGTLLLCLLTPLAATTVVALSDAEVFDRAGTTLLGEVVGIEPGETDQGVIYTEISVQVEECFFSKEIEKIGDAYQFENGIFRFRHWGGELGERKLMIHGSSSFRVGERVLIAIEDAPGSDARFCVGLAQGKFSLQGETARRDMRGLQLLDEQSGALAEGSSDETPVPELLERVRDHYRRKSQENR